MASISEIELPQYKCHKVVQAAKVLWVIPLSNRTQVGLDGVPDVVDVPHLNGNPRHLEPGGYLVKYEDGYRYTSWNPADAFEQGYAPLGELRSGMAFGAAVEALKRGEKVARAGWNGKGMFLALMPGFVIPAAMINERTRKFVTTPDQDLNCGGYIVMWTAQQVWQPGWLASQADILGEDWEIVT